MVIEWFPQGFRPARSGSLAQRMMAAGWTSWIDGTDQDRSPACRSLTDSRFVDRASDASERWPCSLCFISAAVPLAGIPQAGTKGPYLIVNKTLIEGVAVLVLLRV
jgi:hypothetical protein